MISTTTQVAPLSGVTTAECLTGTARRSRWKVEKNAGIARSVTANVHARSICALFTQTA